VPKPLARAGRVTLYFRNCPECAKEISYPWPSSFKQAEQRNSVCKSCRTVRANKSRNAKKENNSAWKGYKGVGYKWFSKYFERRKKKQKTGSITIEDAYNQLEKQGFKCALSDIPLEWSEESGMSIDRINSSIGYELDNIQIVHKDINLMKNHFDQDYFIEMCKRVSSKR
jgi:hypothetical protein